MVVYAMCEPEEKKAFQKTHYRAHDYIDGLVQDCSNAIANALELPQSCSKPPIYMNCTTQIAVVWLLLSAFIITVTS